MKTCQCFALVINLLICCFTGITARLRGAVFAALSSRIVRTSSSLHAVLSVDRLPDTSHFRFRNVTAPIKLSSKHIGTRILAIAQSPQVASRKDAPFTPFASLSNARRAGGMHHAMTLANKEPSGRAANRSGTSKRKLETNEVKLIPAFQNSFNLPTCS